MCSLKFHKIHRKTPVPESHFLLEHLWWLLLNLLNLQRISNIDVQSVTQILKYPAKMFKKSVLFGD